MKTNRINQTYVVISSFDLDGSYASESIPTDEVEVVDIEEDIQGRDLVTFNYKGKQYKSFAYSI